MASCVRKGVVGLLLLAWLNGAWADCRVLDSNQHPVIATDPLFELINRQDVCPRDVFALRAALTRAGLSLKPTMVANRGFHNPSLGSFSLFERVTGSYSAGNTLRHIESGQFFFGHFTELGEDNRLKAAQTPTDKTLMIEVIAWDYHKKYFNFYELRGDGQRGVWFYRGDSKDILADNKNLHRHKNPKQPRFGDRLRCSACHGAGGPIMKELASPHNDWWQASRVLPLGGRAIDESLRAILENLEPADELALGVKKGLKQLVQSPSFARAQVSLSLQERLRPLFCPVEVNFASTAHPLDFESDAIEIPLEFFIDSRLVEAASQPITVSGRDYKAALSDIGSRFPEIDKKDADHPWLTPVKATSDKWMIAQLRKEGLIDEKFINDVLSIDMTNPVFSSARCDLLRFVPVKHTPRWQAQFSANLQASNKPSAQQLLANMKTPNSQERTHQKVREYLKQCRVQVGKPEVLLGLLKLLAQRRLEIRFSDISSNPLGQILEPGFRVIFPETRITPIPGQLTLTSACQLFGDSY